MKDDIWQRDEVESPCVKICVIHPQAQICIGCYRSLAEISTWGAMSPAERRNLMASLPQRAASLAQRRGGRKARLGQNG